MKAFNIIVLISGEGSNLQSIIDHISESRWPIHIKAVISNKADAYGLERANKHHIATHVLSGKAFDTREAYDEALIKLIDNYQPNLIVLAGFMRILSPVFTHHFKNKIINVHPSLLPQYPGLETHASVLKNKDKEHGCTVHYVNDVLDGGPIIAQSKLTVNSDDTVDTLTSRVQALEHALLPQVIFKLANQQKE